MPVVRVFLLFGAVYTVIRICELLQPIIQYYKGKEQYDSTDEALIVGKDKISWLDIKGFHHYRKFLTDYIAVEVKEPEKYIQLASDANKKSMLLNFKRSGALFLITAYSNAFNKEDILKNLEYDLDKHLKRLDSQTD